MVDVTTDEHAELNIYFYGVFISNKSSFQREFDYFR